MLTIIEKIMIISTNAHFMADRYPLPNSNLSNKYGLMGFVYPESDKSPIL